MMSRNSQENLISKSQRNHTCKCGRVLDRDEAAAINIVAKALTTISMDEQSQTSSFELVNANGHINLTEVE